MKRFELKSLEFNGLLLLAPLAYAIHHLEEHVLFNFREWRLRYFPDNNAIPTEAVLSILMAVTLVFIILHLKVGSRYSAWAVIVFLMASQVANVMFHVGFGIWFADFSPGTITALTLYVPANYFICRAALREGWVTPISLTGLFLFGVALFTAFEVFGPAPLAAVTVCLWVIVLWFARKEVTLDVDEAA